MMTNTTNGYADLGDAALYYERAGAGETLVLSHAAFLDSRMFDGIWDALTQHYDVIGYDMRGFGKSSAATGPANRRDDLRRLLDALGVERAHFVGCSNGGELMLDLALEQPQRVASLTLVGATPSGFEMVGEPPRYMMEMFEAMQAGDIERANELQIRILLDGIYREPDQMDAALRQKALTMHQIPAERSTFFIADTQPLNPLTPPAAQRLGEVACPTLVVVGSLDHPELLRAADVMAHSIPNVRKVVMDGTGHVPSYEQPEQFVEILQGFLAQV
jgi:pimeloyl-ACP methyl ester carboxylesterase